MQIGIELVILSSFATIALSGTIGVYLLRLWRRQPTRLMTDLPLVFAITTMAQAIQIFIGQAPNYGLIQPSLELFRFRAIIICISIVPILGALLQIWAPKFQKYHNRAVLAVTAIWIATTLLGPNEEFIMVMVIPWILVFGVVMLATFAITWKTGRLKEVRSDLMIVSIIFGMASQVLRVPLLGSVFFYVPDVFFMLSMLFIAIAFGNPWYRRGLNGKESTPPLREIEVATEY
jgi:MFS family permease